MKSLSIGKVSYVKGVTVKAAIEPHLDKMTYFYDGKTYSGVAINGYICIRKGFLDLVGKIEGEEILEQKNIFDNEGAGQKKFSRYIEVNMIGYLDGDVFHQGVKYLPMIGDDLYLISNEQLSKVFNYKNPQRKFLHNDLDSTLLKTDTLEKIYLGKTLLEGQKIYIPIDSVFASHIGIFGNTGSGKSNTLAKLYFSLFEKKGHLLKDKSKFLILDFNGEYENIFKNFNEHASILKLSTHHKGGEDKLVISENDFWDAELLSVLYAATEKTQKPFLKHLVNNRKKYDEAGALSQYFFNTLGRIFGANQHKETYNLLISLLYEIGTDNSHSVIDFLKSLNIVWHTNRNKYQALSKGDSGFIDSFEKLKNWSSSNIWEIFNLKDELGESSTPFLEITIRAFLQLINSTSENYIQYEYVSPLINKISAVQKDLVKVIEISDNDDENKPIQLISLRDCNAEMKKTIAMLLAKTSFSYHKNAVKNNNSKSFHLIVDEAHNILSEQSTRESATWKDYRLELFEEIIKEGRKFGFFITIASQRPADISTTIVSQLHNYFLHRLVNENDLFLIKNAISTLDANSRSLIPILSAGACVVSGVAFHTPAIVQVDKLAEDRAPNSETISLIDLWSDK